MTGGWWDRVRSYNPAWPYAESEDQYDDDGDPLGDGELAGHLAPISNSREIIVRYPSTLDDAQDVGQCLKAAHPIVVNLEKADSTEARRIVDFLAGVTFALDGHSKRIGDSIFLFTPRTLTINSEEQSFLSGATVVARPQGAAV
jgi:cell division inhibitor SepF